MKKIVQLTATTMTGVFALLGTQLASADPVSFKWKTVVDNNYNPPGITAEKFFSYNQPSINDGGLVVFRARAKKPTGRQSGGEPTRGVFTRHMLRNTAIKAIATTKPPTDVVPPPNNITKPKPATFNEFPAFPRIDKQTNSLAFRGQSQPTWTDPILGKLGGTTGIYANINNGLKTAVRNLEVTAGFPQYFVPSIALDSGSPETRFDQFPGAPAISDAIRVAFKGNYSDNTVSKTGIFYRRNLDTARDVMAIAWTGLKIPDQKGLSTTALFGSTAPPSATNGQVVFAGFDREEEPNAGGIYHVRLGGTAPQLKALVNIGMPVPTLTNANFTRFGEALSFDGRYVSFWGAWNTTPKPDPNNSNNDGWKEVILTCPKDGNKDVIKACKDQDLSDIPNDGIYILYEPENQGIFVYDLEKKTTKLIAKTNDINGFNNFLFWSFTGAPPGVGGGDEGSTDDREPPRWRSSAFSAVNGKNVAFKAKKSNFTNGVYLSHENDSITVVLDSTMTGDVLDNKTIITINNNDGTTANVPLSQLLITSVGLERDGFRNKRLAVSISMADTTATYSWAGIYVGNMEDDD